MLKFYFVIWMVIFVITLDIVNRDYDKKNFGIDAIIFLLFYVFLIFAKISIESGLRIALVIALAIFTVLPNLFKEKFDISKFKITANAFVSFWGIFVAVWVLLKSGTVLSEEQKHSLPNLVGMYYSENCEYRKALDLVSSFTKLNIELVNEARENISDLSPDNTILITESGYRTMWAISTLEYTSTNIDFRSVVNMTNQESIDKALENSNIKYIIRLDPNELTKMNECKSDLERINQTDEINLLYSNDNGYIAEIVGR